MMSSIQQFYQDCLVKFALMGHNPFTLISYLSAVHTEFTADEVESETEALFDEMYTLTLTPDGKRLPSGQLPPAVGAA